MRVFVTIMTSVLMVTSYAVAADEFGARFGGQAPIALQDEAEGLQDIEPAAGDESGNEAAPSPEIIEEKSAEKPSADEATDREQDLEKEMGTDVDSTVQDLGDGQVQQHDSVGEGNVRTFYKSETDGRVMDNNDAVGVEVKVLEFE